MGTYSVHGSMQRGIKQICGTTYTPQYVNWFGQKKEYRTTGKPVQDKIDNTNAEVVLLGTGSSNINQLNFQGFLQEYLDTPVENFSLSGGREIGGWLKYISSGKFALHHPKLIIWELPACYLLDDPMLFAQLLPALSGSCSGQPHLLQTETRMTTNPNPGASLFFTDILRSVPMSELVFRIDFPIREINAITITVWYTDGRRKKKRIRKPGRSNSGGDFIFSLFGDLLRPSVDVIAMEITDIEGTPVTEFIRNNGYTELKIRTTVCRFSSDPSDW
jgi:alginate biosynthesis protein AlgX